MSFTWQRDQVRLLSEPTSQLILKEEDPGLPGESNITTKVIKIGNGGTRQFTISGRYH